MKSFWSARRIIYGIVILISAFIVFFLGQRFDNEKMKNVPYLAWDNVTNFRKGLDVSGGTKLMYRVDYSTYDQTYSGNAQALADVKKTVEEVISKKFDSRISKLGVSNYKSYTQQYDNETQIVVEIGGVADLDQAKQIIGKTVELEFKLPNESEGSDAEKDERKAIAGNLYNDLLDKSDKFEAIAGARDSENILYRKYDKVTLSQLPLIYQDNPGVLNETQEGKISPLMEGAYSVQYFVDENGNIQDEGVLNGYTFFHMISKEAGTRSGTSLNDIREVASSLGYTYDNSPDLVKGGVDVQPGLYEIKGDVLKYNDGEVYPGEDAYDLRILVMASDDTVAGENEDVESPSENSLTINTGSDGSLDNKTLSIKNRLLADHDADITEASPVYDGVLPVSNLRDSIQDFDVDSTDEVQIYEVEGVTYIIVIRDRKSATDHWYNVVTITGVNEEDFSKSLESQTFYTLEEVFVQDSLTWVTAQTTDGRILNGGNFKFAEVKASQLGQPVVAIHFDDNGKEIFCDITKNNIGKRMAIFIGGKEVTSPVIQTDICGGEAQIEGNYTPESAKELTEQLNDGALPAPLILMQEEKVSPTLGENALNGAVLAMIIGFIVIWLYMVFTYGWKKGLVTLISLSVYTLVLFAIVKLFSYALSLSGIAAVILSIGMAVDANVLIFERMKEEKENKKSDSEAIDIAYDRSWNAIRDGQVSTGMIGLLLWLVGISMFKGFGTMLVVGVLLTLLVNAPVIKELLHIFYRRKKEEK